MTGGPKRLRRKGAHGGASTLLDLIAGMAMWAVLLSGMVSLIQIGRVWEAAQHAAYDAAEGVSTYGCWTSSVTSVVQSDVQSVQLSGTPTASIASSDGDGQNDQAIYVGTNADPVINVKVNLPMTVSWVGIGLAKATLTGQANITSSAYHDESAIGGTTCVTPQA